MLTFGKFLHIFTDNFDEFYIKKSHLDESKKM